LIKIEKLAKYYLKIISSETAGQMGPNYGEMVLRWSPFRIISGSPGKISQKNTEYMLNYSSPDSCSKKFELILTKTKAAMDN
jgi:hypothetical protein